MAQHRVIDVGSNEIPEIEVSEMRLALKHLKNEKAPEKVQITSEMLRTKGGFPETALIILINRCLGEGKIPDSWRNAELILLSEKVTKQCIH